MEPVFTYSRPGFKFEVYPNRIDIEEGAPLPKRDTILLRNISDVGVTRLKRLQITTNDGRKREFNVATRADEARAAILSVLT